MNEDRVRTLFTLSSDIENNLKRQTLLIKNEIDRNVWIKNCKESIELLLDILLKNRRASVHFKQHINAVICRLKCLVEQVRYRIWRSGAGLVDNEASTSAAATAATAATFLQWLEVESVFENRIITGMIANIMHIDAKQFLMDCKNIVFEQVRQRLEEHNCIKVNCTFTAEFVIIKLNPDGSIREKTEVKTFPTKNVMILPTTDLDNWYRQIIAKILTSLEEFQERDSGWALSKIINLLLNINKCQLLHGSARFATLPAEIANKKAVINVKSSDNACFAWAIVSALYPCRFNSDRTSSYPHYRDVLNLEGISFPTQLKEISTFERNNQMSINIFILKRVKRTKKFEIFPIAT